MMKACGVILAGLALGAGAAELDLSGTWRLVQADDPAVACAAAVPGGVYWPLVQAKRIPHPYYGMNEPKVQWPAAKEWVFSRTFEVPEELRAAKSVVLRLEDVDCFATVCLNGRVVGRTSNRFQRYDFDVKACLKPGPNAIEVRFDSTEKRSVQEAWKYEKSEYPDAKTGGRHLKLVRTVRCHAGWDWGIALMDEGLMGTVKLISTDLARLDYVYTTQRFAADRSSVDVTVTAEVHSPVGGETDFDAALCGVTAKRRVTLAKGSNRLSLTLKVDRPELWWPRNYGEPKLHRLTVGVGGERLERSVGLRQVELCTDRDAAPDPLSPTNEVGQTFTIRVNGVDVYCQGANWVPCDAMENLQTPERYRDLIASAAAANMNMLRVWGGGQFERDVFYETCDRLGVLVWQDFLFACAIYPVSDYYMAPVRRELEHQLKRLRDHPSIALWCGDNECVHVANHLKDTRWLEACAARERFLTDVVAEFDPTRPFWPASPLKGRGDYRIENQSSGDYHDWGVWYGLLQLKTPYSMQYRFVSEFGFQSHMSPDGLAQWIPADRIDPNTPELHAHQKCKIEKRRGGDETLNWFIADTFRFPCGTDAYFYLSQAVQALSLHYAAGAWRTIRPRCGGFLVWQLNDNWPVTSWSTIEYGGKWKQAHYRLKRDFAPLAVFACEDWTKKDVFDLRAVNDCGGTFEGTARVERRAFDGKVLKTTEFPVVLGPHEGRTVRSVRSSDFGPPEARRAFFVHVVLEGRAGGRPYRATDDWVFDRFRTIDLADATVDVRHVPSAQGTFAVRLEADRPAFLVWADVRGIRGEFDDNSLDLMPGEPRTIVFTPKESGVTEARFRAAFTLRHLRQAYRLAGEAR